MLVNIFGLGDKLGYKYVKGYRGEHQRPLNASTLPLFVVLKSFYGTSTYLITCTTATISFYNIKVHGNQDADLHEHWKVHVYVHAHVHVHVHFCVHFRVMFMVMFMSISMSMSMSISMSIHVYSCQAHVHDHFYIYFHVFVDLHIL